jgi:nucleotide-binding universal stress UspA family protein
MRLILFSTVVLLPFSAQAQTVQVEYEDATPATPQEIARRVEASTKHAVKGCAGWVVSENFRPLRRPAGSTGAGGTTANPSEESGGAAFEFLERVTVLDAVQSAKSAEGVFHLVARGQWGTAGLKILGWVPDSRLLTKPDCLSDPASGVQLKGLVVNSRRYVTEAKQFDLAKILRAPDPAARSLEPFRFFNFYFVYKDTDPDSEDQGFVLLGDQPRFNERQAVSSDREELIRSSGIQGWVRKERVCLWRTREALMWNDQELDREPVLAYADQARALKRDTSTDPRDALEAFEKGAPPRWEADRMRYPIIPFRNAAGKLQLNVKAQSNVLWRIGLIGDVEDEKGNVVIGAGRMQKIQTQLADIRAQLRSTEILFVVDDTGTMRDWFKPARSAILRIIEKARESDREVKAGISFYHDIPDKERSDPANLAKAVATMRVADPRTERFQEMLTKIENKVEQNGYDKREQMYQGLLVSLEDLKSGFTPSGPRKMVVLIGDDGNHELGADEEARVIERIVDRLVPKIDAASEAGSVRTPVEFFALQVAPVDDEHRRAFERQATAIGRKLDERLRTNAKNPDLKDQRRYFRVSNEAELHETIDARYTELSRRAAALDEEVKRLQTGQFSETDLEPGAEGPAGGGKGQTRFRDPELLQLLRSKNLSLKDFAQGVQVFDYHYVWESGRRKSTGKPVTQVRRQLLLSGGNLDEVTGLLKRFFGEGENAPTMSDLAESVQSAQTGEESKRRGDAGQPLCGGSATPQANVGTIQDFLPAQFGVAFVRGVLKRKVDELKGQALAEDIYEVQEIKKRAMLLDDVRKGNRYEYGPLFEDDRSGLKRGRMIGAPGSQKRGFKRGVGNFFWHWIDFEDEWP